MNKHFPRSYDIITDTSSYTSNNAANEPWVGLIPHTDFAITSITIENEAQLTGAAAANFVKDIPVGLPFLCRVTQIELSAGGCKMIKPS